MRFLLAFPCLLLLLAAGPVRAQTTDTASVARALDAPCPGGRVRLHLLSGGSEEGRCGAVMDGRLVLRESSGAAREVPLAGIRSVWVQQRQTGRYAVHGALAGAGAMALVGIFIVNSGCGTSNCRRDYTAPVIASSLAGGAGGLLVGTIAGYSEVRWKRRYP
ncbi:MAG TPA: hypothetical protein VLK84_28645 [Longimicrobium sp.]|nr:hypothetical protein [Longimicrobium sp.]